MLFNYVGILLFFIQTLQPAPHNHETTQNKLKFFSTVLYGLLSCSECKKSDLKKVEFHLDFSQSYFTSLQIHLGVSYYVNLEKSLFLGRSENAWLFFLNQTQCQNYQLEIFTYRQDDRALGRHNLYLHCCQPYFT